MLNCNSCGRDNPDGARFCENCGVPIVAEQISPPLESPAQSSASQGGSFAAPPAQSSAPQGGSFAAPPAQSSAPQGGSFAAPPAQSAPQGGAFAAPPTQSAPQGGAFAAPPTQSAPQGNSFTTTTPQPKPPKKKKTGLIIILVVVALLGVLVIGGIILVATLFVGGSVLSDDSNSIAAANSRITQSTINPAGNSIDPNGGGAPVASEGDVLILNESAVTIFRLYVSENTDSEWGEDVLGSSVISGGESLSVTLPQGSSTYDVKIEDSDGATYEFYGLLLDPGESLVFTSEAGGTLEHYYASGEFYQAVTVTGGVSGTDVNNDTEPVASGDSIQFINESSFTVFRLYMSETTDDQWGDDQLGTSVVSSGEGFMLNLPQSGTYDIKVEDDNGNEYAFTGLVLDPNETLIFSEANGGTIDQYLDSGDLYESYTAV